MISKYITGAVLAASVAVAPADEVAAGDAGSFVAGALIGGLVGSQIQKNRGTRRYTTTRRTYRSRLPSTHEGRQIQSSLNYFGFNAGAVDGQLGRRTRNAVSSYQAYLGYPVTGQLSPYEQNLLITSHNRAQAGGYATNQLIATNPEGTRGLLKTYRAELAGQPVQQYAPTTTVVVNPQPAPQAVQPAGTTLTTTTTVDAVKTPEVVTASNELPNFFDSGSQVSLASHCNTVSLVTNTNGGFTTLASMTDPNIALNEQFCLARTYAITRSEELISKVSGFTPQQIATQCAGFGPALKDHVAALSLKSRDQVVNDVSGFILGTGMSPAQLSGTARICLGVGYRTDNMDVALGSALMLYAMGEGVYGELMGHHLAQGFGTSKRVDVAATWYQAGLAAADNGAEAVFVPGQPERTELIRKASVQINGASVAPSAGATVQSASTLPVFSVTE
ncbi:MAG: peptidoglycan-binding domain-containing protein [Sulfitobacter sp.]